MIQILLVEDNPADTRLLKEYLLEAGPGEYQVRSVVRLAEAIERMAGNSIDVVLLDLGLPDSQGLDTFYRLHAVAPDMPIVLLTGLQDEQISPLAIQTCAQDHLNKNEINCALLDRTLRYAIERQRSHMALQSSEQRLRRVIDQNSIPILVLSMEGIILFANPAAATLFGRTFNEMLGLEFGFPLIVEQKTEITILHSSNRVIYAELGVSDTVWEGQQVYLASLHDITARKEAETALRKTSEQLTDMLQSISDGFFSVNFDGIITYFNKAAERLLKMPADKALGQPFFEVFPEVKGSFFEENFTRVLKTKTGVAFESYFSVKPYANWYDVRVSPFEDGILVYFQVTTERKKVEQERQWEMRLNVALSNLYKPLISPEATVTNIGREVLHSACELTGSTSGFITSFDPVEKDKRKMIVAITKINGQFEEDMLGVDLPAFAKVGMPEMWESFLNIREPVYNNCPSEVDNLVNLPPNHKKLNQLLAMPILLGERLVGQVVLGNPQCDYNDRDIEMTRRLAEFYGLAVQRWEAEEALRLARDDSQRLFQSEREQRELAETLREIVALLVTAPDQAELFHRLLDQVGRVVPFDQAVIYLVVGDRVHPVHWSGFGRFQLEDYVSTIDYRISDHLNISWMYETGSPIVIPDTHNHPGWVIYPESIFIRSYAGVPIRAHDQVIGFLSVHSVVPGFYNQSHIERLTIFSDEAAIALENARLLEETRHRLNELEVINKISASLRTAETLDQMLPIFVDGLLNAVNLTDGAILLFNPESNTLRMHVRRGLYAVYSIPPLQPGEGIMGHVFETGETYLAPDFSTDPLAYQPSLAQIQAGTGGVCLPLRTAREIVGVLTVSFPTAKQPTPDEIHLMETLVEISGNTFHRLRLHEETETRLQALTALRTIDLAIATSFDLRITLNVLLEQTISQLKVDAADILLYNSTLQLLEYKASRGFSGRMVEQTRLQLGQGYAGQAALEGRTIYLPDLHDRSITFSRFLHLTGERFVSYFAVPLMIKGDVKGVLELFLRSEFMPTSDWQDFLEALARQAAIAIDNAQLFDSLQHSRVELAMAYDFTLEGWARAVDLRDQETEEHTKRIVEMTVQLARRSGFNETELVHVRRGALLHDIGKIGVPDKILTKPGPLTDEEWVEMRKHPGFAKEFIEDIEYLRQAMDIPYCHHEHWDGSGYPRHLKGEDIPKSARIFSVVDVYDALTNDRVYRKAWPKEKVLDYLRDKKDKEFDPKVVEDFILMLEEEYSDQ